MFNKNSFDKSTGFNTHKNYSFGNTQLPQTNPFANNNTQLPQTNYQGFGSQTNYQGTVQTNQNYQVPSNLNTNYQGFCSNVNYITPQEPSQETPQETQSIIKDIDKLNEKDLSKKAKSFNNINIIPVLTNIKSENEISFSTNITKNTSLLIPIISLSNNIKNIINLNLLGGLGIFKSDDIENQINFINTVKNHLKYIDETPITINYNATYSEIKNTFLNYTLDYIAVIDDSNIFLGFITKNYLDIVSVLDNNICAHQIMTPLDNLKSYKTYDYNWKELLTERPPLDIINNLKTFQIIPIICDNKKLQGVITLKNFTTFYTYRNKALIDKKGKLITAISTGIFSDSINRIDKLVNAGLDFIFIKLDNGYNNSLINVIKDIKYKFPNLKIMIGDIHSSNAFKYLSEAGADCISVGNETEFGQFTLLQECFDLSKIYNVPIINNSGIPTQNKNIFKAFVAGSHSILIPDDSTFNYKIEEVLEFIKNGLVSLNVIDIKHLHSTNIEYTITN